MTAENFAARLKQVDLVINGSENMFVYQPTSSVLELKKDKSNEYIIGWKSKGVWNSKLIA